MSDGNINIIHDGKRYYYARESVPDVRRDLYENGISTYPYTALTDNAEDAVRLFLSDWMHGHTTKPEQVDIYYVEVPRSAGNTAGMNQLFRWSDDIKGLYFYAYKGHIPDKYFMDHETIDIDYTNNH